MDCTVYIAPLNAFADSASFAAHCLAPRGIRAALCHDAGGRPYLEGSTLCISLSHSRTHRALAVSESPVGVDVELIRPIEHLRIVRRFFSPEEAGFLQRQACVDAFFTLWGMKESYAKLCGRALVEVLRDTVFVRGGKLLQEYEGLAFYAAQLECNALCVYGCAQPHIERIQN